MEKLTPEKLDSWYIPRTFENMTEREEKATDDIHICDTCEGEKEVNIASEPDEENLVPCPDCCAGYYEEER